MFCKQVSIQKLFLKKMFVETKLRIKISNCPLTNLIQSFFLKCLEQNKDHLSAYCDTTRSKMIEVNIK